MNERTCGLKLAKQPDRQIRERQFSVGGHASEGFEAPGRHCGRFAVSYHSDQGNARRTETERFNSDSQSCQFFGRRYFLYEFK